MISTLAPIRLLAPLLVAMITVPPVLPTLPSDLPDELSTVPKRWLRQYWERKQEEANLLIAAYELDEEILPAFWHDFYTLLADLYAYDRVFFVETSRLPPDEMLKRYQEYPNEMPMSDEKLIAMVESLLGPADYTIPEQRYLELKDRQKLRTWVDQDQMILTKDVHRWFRNTRGQHIAHRTEAGHPMPYWVTINRRNQAIRDEAQSWVANREARLATRRQSSRVPGGTALRRHQATIKPPLEPEDSIARPTVTAAPAIKRIEPGIDATRRAWRSAVEAAINQDESYREQAERVFDEVWARVEASRSSRAAEYEALEAISDKRAYAARLAELDRPLSGLFAELRCRLASLPIQN